ncbi:uncharacterized protein LOC131956678 [Physella acuta]|uniref:uncharacterized protein LOC131956678 n=1 Tax=Physella acuta TaxID=109671 RepID=UPI0027DC4904|nr:uncharacterized protein LOC131956678 [Physella acuta]
MWYNVMIVAAMLAVSQGYDAVSLTQADIGAFLDAHNAERATAGIAALAWNDTLAEFAQAFIGNCVFKHSGGPYGENLYASMPANTDHPTIAGKAVKQWIAEKSVQTPDWSCITSSPTCGHYSQVVWGKSLQVGCAIIHCPTETKAWPNMVVCEYFPRGNFVGQKPF